MKITKYTKKFVQMLSNIIVSKNITALIEQFGSFAPDTIRRGLVIKKAANLSDLSAEDFLASCERNEVSGDASLERTAVSYAFIKENLGSEMASYFLNGSPALSSEVTRYVDTHDITGGRAHAFVLANTFNNKTQNEISFRRSAALYSMLSAAHQDTTTIINIREMTNSIGYIVNQTSTTEEVLEKSDGKTAWYDFVGEWQQAATAWIWGEGSPTQEQELLSKALIRQRSKDYLDFEGLTYVKSGLGDGSSINKLIRNIFR